jgi:hypothetical protein
MKINWGFVFNQAVGWWCAAWLMAGMVVATVTAIDRLDVVQMVSAFVSLFVGALFLAVVARYWDAYSNGMDVLIDGFMRRVLGIIPVEETEQYRVPIVTARGFVYVVALFLLAVTVSLAAMAFDEQMRAVYEPYGSPNLLIALPVIMLFFAPVLVWYLRREVERKVEASKAAGLPYIEVQ